ncbi:hypothetical protein HNQ91_001683 [Filimonas zeae]|nr:hypothetical protein [Filimonas zeae]
MFAWNNFLVGIENFPVKSVMFLNDIKVFLVEMENFLRESESFLNEQESFLMELEALFFRPEVNTEDCRLLL